MKLQLLQMDTDLQLQGLMLEYYILQSFLGLLLNFFCLKYIQIFLDVMFLRAPQKKMNIL